MNIKKTAIILAGGKGSRLNYADKAFLRFNNTTFIELLVKKVLFFDEIIIVTNNKNSYNSLSFLNNPNIKLISDAVRDIGPLGGILSGLLAAKYDESLIISCDTPLIHEGFLMFLYNQQSDFMFTIPISKNGIEPLIALYKKSALPLIKVAIEEKKYKLSYLFLEKNTRYLPIKDLVNYQEIENGLLNINTQEDLEEMWTFLT